MSGHTPGPWRTDPDVGNESVLGADGIMVADCSIFTARNHRRNPAINQANARLIAAAPDLLNLVRRFIALSGGVWNPERYAAEEAELMQEARAAIAKARGEQS